MIRTCVPLPRSNASFSAADRGFSPRRTTRAGWLHHRNNALRLAGALAKRDDVVVRVFLMADAVGAAVLGQQLPDGYSDVDRMLKSIIRHGGEVGLCGTCMDARAAEEGRLVEGTRRSSLEELASWTVWADKVVTF